jgi:[acyl-carrier-protein] S-malonyltransferase
MSLAILCSGQGQQHPGMFALTGNAPAAANLFAHAATLLSGLDPRDLVQTAPSSTLHRNRVAQILCTLQALAAAATLRDAMPDRSIVAGYSVGEMAAWGVAGLLSQYDTLDLVARRAELMDAATPAGDGMLFVRGISRQAVDGLCKRYDTAIAIVEPGDAFVLGGSREALELLGDEAKAMKATHVVDIPVEVASHTKRLGSASLAFREVLSQVPVRPPTTSSRLLSGTDGAPVIELDRGLDKLAAQISHTVHWADCLQGCVEARASAFLELGPGSALSNIVAGAYRELPTRSLEDFRTLEGARAWITHHLGC